MRLSGPPSFVPSLGMRLPICRYLVVLFKGLNALTNLGYEGGSPSNTWDMIIAISMFFVQIIVQAYILGTLFHYLVKKGKLNFFEQAVLRQMQKS